MKGLILLLIVLSFIVGIPTNLGWFGLFSSEFLGPISEITGKVIAPERMIAWFILLMSHLSLVSLVFLVNKPYFNTLLYFVPPTFFIIFGLFDFFAWFFLIPFVIVWIISLFKQGRRSSLALK
ncbi:hypothetical protein [Mucilaginibacter sp.]|uniref:hypothetical protein n=1 Tax=Mucilaginibacter sp. TaxID=1882438 RepID=UPI003B00EFC0